jgi:guanylate kinase
MNNKVIFCLMGKSSSGKDTIKKYLLEKDKDLSAMIPFTTRPPRKGEKNHIDYEFINREDFAARDDILEHRMYQVNLSNGEKDTWYYGHFFPTENYSLMIGTLETYNFMKSNFRNQYVIIPIYITISEEDRLYRMILRENKNEVKNYKELSRRFIKDQSDFSMENLEKSNITKEYIFANNDLKSDGKDIYNFIKRMKEWHKV